MSVLDGLIVSGSRLVKWIDSQSIIIQALHHSRNAIGLGGPWKGGDRWDKWFDLFLEGGITENYTWDQKKLKMEGLDDSSRCTLRQEIIALATKERSKLKILQEFLTRKSAGSSSSLPSKVNSEGVNATKVDNRTPATETPDTFLSPKEKPKDDLQSKGDSKKRPIGSVDETPKPQKRICLKLDAKVRPPAASLVFETHLRPSEKIKLIYAVDTPTLSQFLQKVRKRWNIPEEHGVESFDVDVGGKIFEVDPNEERDWIFVLEAVRQKGIIAVTVIIRVSKTSA